MSHRILGALTALAVTLAAGRAVSTQSQAPAAAPPPTALVTNYESFTVGPVPPELGYDPAFYRKYVDAIGIPVISSEKVPDRALLMARDIVVYMLANRPDIRREMAAKKYRVGIMAVTEMTTDIPEQRDRKKPARDDPRLTRSRARELRPARRHRQPDRQGVLGSPRPRPRRRLHDRRRGERPRLRGHALLRRAHPRARVVARHHERDPHRRSAALRRDSGRLQRGDVEGPVQGPLRRDHGQRVLGRGHAVVVLVELRVDGHERHAAADARTI